MTTPAGMPLPDRLNIIYQGVFQIVSTYKPDAVALEELFFSRNVTTAIAASDRLMDFVDGMFEVLEHEVSPSLLDCSVDALDEALLLG